VSAPAAQGRTAVAEIRSTIVRVQYASVDDDPGACALMSRRVQHQLRSGLGAHPHATCRQAVRRIHAAFVAGEEVGSARQIVRGELVTLKSSPILFAFGLRHASVTVVGVDAGGLETTLTFTLVKAGPRWKVATFNEQQQTL
jgi:hypothetical protein